jgi:hypothetical protein
MCVVTIEELYLELVLHIRIIDMYTVLYLYKGA